MIGFARCKQPCCEPFPLWSVYCCSQFMIPFRWWHQSVLIRSKSLRYSLTIGIYLVASAPRLFSYKIYIIRRIRRIFKHIGRGVYRQQSMSIWWPLLGLSSWCPILKSSQQVIRRLHIQLIWHIVAEIMSTVILFWLCVRASARATVTRLHNECLDYRVKFVVLQWHLTVLYCARWIVL